MILGFGKQRDRKWREKEVTNQRTTTINANGLLNEIFTGSEKLLSCIVAIRRERIIRERV